MKKFGGNVSVQVLLHILRVDIVDSETSTTQQKGKGKSKKSPKFHIDTGFETPAFLCDTFGVMISMLDVVDFEKDKEEFEGLGLGGFGHEYRRRSLKALRLAMNHMEAPATTTKVNFNVNCTSVNQHVNMSMLRLAHQFVTMIENINETRTELKGVTNIDLSSYKTHRKQDSKGSSTATGTDTQSVGPMEVPKMSDLETPLSDLPKVIGSESMTSQQITSSYQISSIRPDKLSLTKSPWKLSARKQQEKGKFELLGSKFGTETMEEPSGIQAQSPPFSLNLSDTVPVEVPDTSSPALAEKTIVDEIRENTPKCWRTLYHLLDLYSTMPETKTLGSRPAQSRLSVIDEEPEKVSQTHSLPQPSSALKVNREDLDTVERQPLTRLTPPPPTTTTTTRVIPRTYTGNTFTQSMYCYHIYAILVNSFEHCIITLIN